MAPRKRKNHVPLRARVEQNEDTIENQLKMLKDSVVTDSMMESFTSMATALACPLCGRVINTPQTLAACAHSFCATCIDDYACNNWQCPGMYPPNTLAYEEVILNFHPAPYSHQFICFVKLQLLPVPGCGQPIALRGSRRGKFRKTNPSLETIATSWKTIHNALSRAPPGWWKEESPAKTNSSSENDESLV